MLVHRFVLVRVAAVVVGLCAMSSVVRAEDSLWQTDFEAAKAKAKSEKKLLLVDFTGSDWCGWCVKLKNEVFDKEPFKTEASKQFVFVELDFPHGKKLSDKLKKQNKELSEKFKVRGFPTILVMDAEGKKIAKTGYRPGGPEGYVKHLGGIVKAHESILESRKQLDKIAGLDRAKLLDQLIDDYAKLDDEKNDEQLAWSKEIVALDPENKAGLKVKHEFVLLMVECGKLKEQRKFDEAKAVVEKALALPGVSGEQKQEAYFAQGEFCFMQRDFAGIVACLNKAVEAAPETDKAKEFKQMVQRFKPMAEMQQKIAKLSADAEKATGLDRAKLLDELIAIQPQARMMGRGAKPEQTEKWCGEIVKLDADNKAGLKYKVLAAKSQTLLKAKKVKEGQAVLGEILAIAGLTADQTQETNFALGNSYAGEKDFAKAIECLKKALEAAPDSPKAKAIKAEIEKAEKDKDGDKAK